MALFAAALLPILLAGRFVYMAAAALGGIGIGLFIDEVGKLITAENDYFYPAAAPIIYATFLLAVLVWLRARAPDDPDPRSQLLTALELFEESVEGDLQRGERDELRDRLASAAVRPPRLRSNAALALTHCSASSRPASCASRPILSTGSAAFAPAGDAVPDRPPLGGRGLRLVIVGALLVTGIGQVLALWGIGSEVRLEF